VWQEVETMVSDHTKRQQHWIYVLGGSELLDKARKWEQRKTQQGKAYSVIVSAPLGAHGRLSHVNNDDVLYVFADTVQGGKLGECRISPEELARHLRAEGLDPRHRSVKLFASHTGDAIGSTCFAQQLYEAMRPAYPELVVYGYRGKADAEGFDGHKTAGLGDDESLQHLTHERWLLKRARALDNRVQFPPQSNAEQG
jgi:hypothetical protein